MKITDFILKPKIHALRGYVSSWDFCCFEVKSAENKNPGLNRISSRKKHLLNTIEAFAFLRYTLYGNEWCYFRLCL